MSVPLERQRCVWSFAVAFWFAAGPAVAEDTKKAAVKTIPLDTVYTTSPQQGLKRLTADDFRPKKKTKAPIANPLQTILREFKSGASDMFFVYHESIVDAVRRTSGILTSGVTRIDPSPEEEAKRKPGKARSLWVVAYLGMAGDGLDYVLESVEIVGSSIKVAYKKTSKQGKDVIPYLYWIRTGELNPDLYRLELFDSQEKQITLSRQLKLQ